MRCVIVGVGAVGGALAAALHHSGTEVLGVARGAMLAAINAGGLLFRTPHGDIHARFDCVGDAAQVSLRPDDVVLLCTKAQDSHAALVGLRAAGLTDQPVFCFQNGVANERLALRLFPNVHGVLVMMPVTYLEPGKVVGFVTPRHGAFAMGRIPGGVTAQDTALAARLDAAGFAAVTDPEVMALKYHKLLFNLGNIVQAALGRGIEAGTLWTEIKMEARLVLAAAGVCCVDPEHRHPGLSALIQSGDVPGETRIGGSTTQSLARGASRLETDYLNGEIALLARLHDVAAPLNCALTQLGADLLRRKAQPGGMSLAALKAALGREG